ncbi:MAG: S-layer homology domain-containing protein [Chloroflexia bacterium]
MSTDKPHPPFQARPGQLAGLASPTPPPPCGLAWRIVSSPNPGTSTNYLHDVVALSYDDVWSVGNYGGATRGVLVEHWDGTEWGIVDAPSPGTSISILNGIDALTPDDIWAGGRQSNGGASKVLAERWDGTEWNVIPGPETGITDTHIFLDIDAISHDDVWGVGYYLSEGFPHALTEHWDGSEWRIIPNPNVSPNGSELWGVSAVSSNDVWAVGHSYGRATLTMHWDGNEWSIIPSPNLSEVTNLLDVVALATNDVWAVGQEGRNTLTLHWDGTAWNHIHSPSPGLPTEHQLYAIDAVSPNDIWAVGYYPDNDWSMTLSLHWDGTAWSHIPSPSPGRLQSILNGVSAVSATEVWSAGYYIEGFGLPAKTLILQYSDPCMGATSTPVPSPSPSRTPSSTPSGTQTTAPTQGTTTVTSTAISTAISTATACPLQFTDVPSDHTFYANIRCLACRGIINGYSSGCEAGNPCFRPGNLVTRGQLAKIVSNSAGFSEPAGSQQFQDVPPGHTFYDLVWRLADRGIINGYPCGGTSEPCVPPDNLPYFRPNADITRGQISKIVAEAAGLTQPPGAQQFEDVPPGHTFYDYIWRLTDLGIMNGYPCGGEGEPCNPPDNRPYFRPGKNATRGQASKIVANTFFPECVTPGR